MMLISKTERRRMQTCWKNIENISLCWNVVSTLKNVEIGCLSTNTWLTNLHKYNIAGVEYFLFS
jgi:hypothetical protein